KEPVKPNVLFLFTDDQRADALSFTGNKHIQTPNIDQLAREGSFFTNAYVMGGHHGAICAPSRAMMLSGKSLFHVYDRLKDVETMPMRFGNHGYVTFGTGKWHNEKEAFEASFQQGSQVFLGGMADHFNIAVRELSDEGILSEPVMQGFSTDLFADAAINFIDEYSASGQENPFFCYVSFTVPHDPYSPAPEYIDRYNQDSLPLPANYMPYHPFVFDDMTVRDENLTSWPRKPEVIQAILADYYALIHHLDDRIGDIVEVLKKNNLYDNTIIVYAADNGLAVGSHGLLGKQNLYEHSTRVPVILKGPGIPENEHFDAFVYLYDLYPTLAELAGIPPPEGIDGLSLSNVLNGTINEIRSSLFTAYRHTVRSVREKEWKLIRYPERDYTQLFNLSSDPHEMINLAGDSQYDKKTEELMALLKVWQQQSGDTAKLTASKILPLDYDPESLVRKPDRWQPSYTLEKYFDSKE
uniref:sulfatase-like hydrolase/transferase n=1 Tax=Aquiflexum sp. TaxID=1872584 RepID=UPI003593054F